jgi:2-octaprenyl-6-methoxyphenol hydroxylase
MSYLRLMGANDFDVVVAGAGLAGATLAVALARGGLRVALVDPQPFEAQTAAAFDGRASAISYAPFRIWRTLGVAERLAEAQPINGMVVTEGAPSSAAPRLPSPAWIGFELSDLDGVDAGEPLGWMIENRHARAALAEAVAEAGVTVIAPATVESVEPDAAGATVRLAGGAPLRAALVAAADGRDSALRRAAGIDVTGWDYEQSALVATVSHERPHEGVARQVFLPSGPLAVLPLTGNRSSLVWTEAPERAKALASVAPEAFASLLLRRIGGALGAVTLEGPRWTHALRLQLAEQHVGERLALVGDAACSVHPLAGQGLNLGLKDAAALAETLVDAARLGEDIGLAAVLHRYARRRRFDAATLAAATDGLRRIYAERNPSVRAVRGAGVALANGFGPARRFFAREAGGAAGAAPRLLRGLPL